MPIEQSLCPDNLTFETYDINPGLERYHPHQFQFDVIHLRSVITGIHDFDKTLEDIQLCLKPGGLLMIINGDVTLYGEDQLHIVKIPDPEKEGPNSEGSYLRKLSYGKLGPYSVSSRGKISILNKLSTTL
jgi:hypothetical protein